jgi:hypothetical protein
MPARHLPVFGMLNLDRQLPHVTFRLCGVAAIPSERSVGRLFLNPEDVMLSHKVLRIGSLAGLIDAAVVFRLRPSFSAVRVQ